MSTELVLEIIKNISHTIREEGELADYYFEWKTMDRNKECLIFKWSENKISFSENTCMLQYWSDTGIKYLLFKRFSTEEERFQYSLISDGVFSTECEDALAVLVRNLFAYLRDGMSMYREELYKNGLD